MRLSKKAFALMGAAATVSLSLIGLTGTQAVAADGTWNREMSGNYQVYANGPASETYSAGGRNRPAPAEHNSRGAASCDDVHAA